VQYHAAKDCFTVIPSYDNKEYEFSYKKAQTMRKNVKEMVRKAKITRVDDLGTIFIVHLDGREPVYMDHRMFRDMEESEENLVGKLIKVHKEDSKMEWIEFLDG